MPKVKLHKSRRNLRNLKTNIVGDHKEMAMGLRPRFGATANNPIAKGQSK